MLTQLILENIHCSLFFWENKNLLGKNISVADTTGWCNDMFEEFGLTSVQTAQSPLEVQKVL